MRRTALAVVVGLAAGCASKTPTEPNLLDREFASYRTEREERRLDEVEARYAKARAEADRLEAELRRVEAEIEARRVRLSDATRARLRLPDPVRVGPAATPAAGTPTPPAGAPPGPGGPK